MLNELEKLVAELCTTNSNNDKKNILKQYSSLKELLFYIYNPFYIFSVTSKSVLKYKKKDVTKNNETLLELLNNLRTRKYTGHEAIRKILGFIEVNGHQELVLKIVDKDLKTRCGVKQINDVFPDLIPEFSVKLADRYDKQQKYFEQGGKWFISRKLDGVRCICMIDVENKTVNFYSREGNQFDTLGKLEEELKTKLIPKISQNIVLDGEVCIMENGKESFASVMKEIKKKDHTIKNPKYLLFDMLTEKEFNKKISKRVFSQRYENLNKVIKAIKNTNTFERLEQFEYTKELFEEMNQKVVQEGWEGLMLVKDVEYEGKRTKNILKVKTFFVEEYKVVGLTFDTITNNGSEYANMTGLKTAQIEHKGNIVDVGSGFSCEERKYYYDHPNKLNDKIISVQYFEETTTEEKGKTKYSLRFPTFRGVYGKTRDF